MLSFAYNAYASEPGASLRTTVRQPDTVVGLTQASTVRAVVRSRSGASAIDTRLLVPLNDRAFPFLPAAVQVAPTIEPVWPLPVASAVVPPVPSLKA